MAKPLALMTVPEAAALLRCTPKTLRNWIHARRIPSYKVGGRRLLAQTDIDAVIDAGRCEALVPLPTLARGRG